MTEPEQQLLCRRFDLGTPLSFRQLGGTRNRNFLLDATSGNWFVRHRYVGYCQPDRLAFDHQALAHLKAHGVNVVAARCSQDGKTWIEEEGNTWEVFSAISGRTFKEGEPGDLRAMALELSAFHAAGREFAIRHDKLGPRGETDPDELLRLYQAIDPHAQAARRYREWVIQAADNLSDDQFSHLPHTLIHGDVQPANILIDDDGKAFFVDLDWCAWRPRIYDLAFAILLCCADHAEPIRGEDIWSLSQPASIRRDLTELFLESYSSSAWPLDASERAALHWQDILSWCHCRLAGAMKVEPARRQEFLARPPQELDELFSDASL